MFDSLAVDFPLLIFAFISQYLTESTLLCWIKNQCFLSCQTLAEEMDTQNERLGWLNKHAPKILASPSVSPQSTDLHVGKLRAINLNWCKVPTYHPPNFSIHKHHCGCHNVSCPPCFSAVSTSPYLSFFTHSGDSRVAGQSEGGGSQPAESGPVPGENEQTHWLGHHHAPDDRDKRPESWPSTGRSKVQRLSEYFQRGNTPNLTNTDAKTMK